MHSLLDPFRTSPSLNAALSISGALVALPLLGDLAPLLVADETGDWIRAQPIKPFELHLARTAHVAISLCVLALGALVPAALKAVRKGGRVVCGGIHMSDIPSFPYRLLWEERHIVSVANLTRADAREFLALAPQAGVKTEVTRYPLEAANTALSDLREGRLQGAAVLIP